MPILAPALLRQLAGMGNNLNQIARKINGGSGQGSTGCSRLEQVQQQRQKERVKEQYYTGPTL